MSKMSTLLIFCAYLDFCWSEPRSDGDFLSYNIETS